MNIQDDIDYLRRVTANIEAGVGVCKHFKSGERCYLCPIYKDCDGGNAYSGSRGEQYFEWKVNMVHDKMEQLKNKIKVIKAWTEL